MKIGVLSDTHVHTFDDGILLAEKLLSGPFRDADVVLHAGDQVIPELSSCFAPLPWYGVQGNMDRAAGTLPARRILQLGGFSIGMTHGWGPLQGLEVRVLETFSPTDIDIVIYGHSHYPVCRQEGSLLVMNPGSPTDKRKAPFHTVGLLTLGCRARGEIIRLD